VTGLLFKKRAKVVTRPRWWPPPLEQLLFLSPYVVWCCVPSYISRTERMHIISPPFFWLLVSIPNTGLYISICPRVWDRHTVSYRSHDPTFLSALSFRLNLSTFPIPSIHPSIQTQKGVLFSLLFSLNYDAELRNITHRRMTSHTAGEWGSCMHGLLRWKAEADGT
jgi:hypothetical protein